MKKKNRQIIGVIGLAICYVFIYWVLPLVYGYWVYNGILAVTIAHIVFIVFSSVGFGLITLIRWALDI
jgi:hypothetical protein